MEPAHSRDEGICISGYGDLCRNQRGRGRRGGRVVRGRGRKRRCGPSGGGTLRRKSPQVGQRPSLPRGLVASARNQWPRAAHSGLMHCTVKPGRYCIASPSPLAAEVLAAVPRRKRLGRGSAAGPGHGQGTRGNSTSDGAHSGLNRLVCQEKTIQDIVVRLLMRNRGPCRAQYVIEPSHAGLMSVQVRSRLSGPSNRAA
jgi:hypothetical protein